MSTATLIWIVSGIGALLFFLAGVLVARSKASATAAAGFGRGGTEAFQERQAELERDLEAARMNNASLRVEVAKLPELEALARKSARAASDLAAARSSLDELRADSKRAKDSVRRLESERDRVQAELRASGERHQERVRRLEAERDRIQAELRAATRAGTDASAARAELDKVSKERQDLAERVDLLERRLADSEGLARDNEALRESLVEAERRAAEVTALQRAEVDRKDLGVELEVLRGRLAELEHLREENQELRAASTERDALKAQVVDMTQEVAALRAQGLSRARRPSAPIPPINGQRCTEGTLQSLLNGIAASPGMRSAVLADELGLPIVGIGEHSGPLAAFGGFMDTIAAKTSAFLPMEGIQRVQVQDQHGATVSAFPLALDKSRIALVTLTVDSVPTTQQMTRLLRSAATMVQ